jgi:hypothetical protein
MLGDVDGGRLARGADDDDAVGALGDMPVDEGLQAGKVERAVGRHRGDDRDDAAGKRSGQVGALKKGDFTLPCRLFPPGGEPLQGGGARLVHREVLVGDDAQAAAHGLQQFPGASRKAGFEGLPKRSLPCAKVS